MNALLHSFSLVALAEIGDKTQLLSILLAAKFKRFWPIFFGILFATLLNHGASAWIGEFVASYITPNLIAKISAILFIAIGFWILVPDKEPEANDEVKFNAFFASFIMFFIAEIGDKTQFATITLGAEYNDLFMVTVGTTIGMMAANVPAILFGENILRVIPMNFFRYAASLMFIGFGVFKLL
jgi:putative Ca2+/H+ antiporter (TMEM165/GDT1 family)